MILIITRRCDDGNKLFPLGAGQHSIVKRGHLSLPRETGQPTDLRQRPSRKGGVQGGADGKIGDSARFTCHSYTRTFEGNVLNI